MRAAIVTALLVATAGGCHHPDALAKKDATTRQAFGMHWKVLGGTWESAGDALVGSGGNVESAETFGDGVLDVDVELLSGPPDHDVGVAFRFHATGGDPAKGNGYGFNFSHAKKSRFVRGADGAYQTISTIPAEAPAANLDGQKNHIRVKMVGKSFDVEVNGKAFAHFEDNKSASGGISFWVDSMSSRVRFSHVTFQSL